jgi:protein SCO1/2
VAKVSGVALRVVIALVTLIGVVACQREPEQRTYQLRGQVLAVKPESREILVKHDDIPGFMPAMTMPYTVKDESLVRDRAPGDLIDATLVVAEGAAWLSAITKTGNAPLPEDAPSKIPPAAGVHLLQPGDPVPETSLTDQDEKTISLANWRGSAVVMTFIYVRCPLPEFCPLMDRRFAEVQTLSASDPTLRGRVRLLSVSFDPEQDRPAVLREQARTLKADPAVWRFATAPADIVDRFAATFGVNVIREKDGTITHNLRTAVIRPDGRVFSIADGNQWTAEQIVADLRRALTS